MQRNRLYFFDTPRTTAGAKLNSQNIPSETTFRDLLDSIPFKNESGDYATEAIQGLVKLASVASSKARSSTSGIGVVLPSHLPTLEVDGTEIGSSHASASYQGIKVTPIDESKHLSYQVDLDPTSIVEKTTPDSADYVLISDSGAAFIPKKVLVSNFSTASYLKRTLTVLSPVTAGDSLDMGSGDITGRALYTTWDTDTRISPKTASSNVGANLHVTAGDAQHAAAGKTGGLLYLSGGLGVNGNPNGNVAMCYDGSSKIGVAGIGGYTLSQYAMLSVFGNLYVSGYINAGVLTPNPASPPSGGGSAIIDAATGNVGWYSAKATMDGLLATTVTAKSVLWFNGTAYTPLAIGATGDKYLRVNSSLNLEAGDLVLTGKVLNASFGELIAWSKMATLTANVVPVTDSNGNLIASGVTTAQLGYLSAVMGDIQSQIDSLASNVASWAAISTTTVLPTAAFKAAYSVNSLSGAVSLTLPATSTLQQNQVVEISNAGGNGTTIYVNGADTGFVTVRGASVSNITLGDGDSAKFIINGTTWVQIR